MTYFDSLSFSTILLTKFGDVIANFWCRCKVSISTYHKMRYIMPCAWHVKEFDPEIVWKHVKDE